MGEKLKMKYCPLCGSEEVHIEGFRDGIGNMNYYVECYEDDCGATSGFHETEKIAVDAWNTRVKESE